MNVNETQQNSFNENSDDDAEEYFLQATPGAYDIKEKIRAANDELFEDFESYNNATREQRVTFKEDLVDYEPDYSSDDGYVQSPDALSLSDNENDHIYEHIGHQSLESISEVPTQESFETEDKKYDNDSGKCELNNDSEKCEINNDSEKCEIDNSLNNVNEESLGQGEKCEIDNSLNNVNEDNQGQGEKCEIDNLLNNVNEETQDQVEQKIETFDAIEVEEENIVEEEILTDNSEQSDQLKTECDDKSSEEDITGEDDILDEDKSIEVIEIINDTDEDVEDDISETLSTINDEEDNTKDVLDSKTSTNKKCSSKIDKVNCRIHCLEKKDLDKITGGSKAIVNISKGPILKLRQRPCCTNQNAKPRLPVYNGLLSEYGLTKAQLERRKRTKEKSLQRKREKSNRINEEKRQKEMFNEEIFCAWLKSVRQRSGNNDKENRKNKHGTSQMRLRPSTCNVASCVKKEQVRRRPSTSPCKSCSYTTILVTPTMTIKEVIMYKKKCV